MKKNLLSMIILGLLVVNIVLTTIMLFSITGSNKRTNSLITSIAQIISLELENAGSAEEGEADVPIENVETLVLGDAMTIPLAIDPTETDAKQHYAILTVTLAVNNKDEGYSKYFQNMGNYENLIKDEIIEVVKKHTLADMRDNSEAIKGEILERIQDMFDSKFIFRVAFEGMYQ